MNKKNDKKLRAHVVKCSNTYHVSACNHRELDVHVDVERIYERGPKCFYQPHLNTLGLPRVGILEYSSTLILEYSKFSTSGYHFHFWSSFSQVICVFF